MNGVLSSLLSTLKKVEGIIEWPQLLHVKVSGINVRFAKDLLMIKGYLGSEPMMVIDAGAAHGEYSRAALFLFPMAKVIAFEPLSDSFIKLADVASKNEKFQAKNCALGSENKQVEFHVNQFSFSSSMLKMTSVHKEEFPWTKNESKTWVSCRRMDSTLEHEISRPCLLKMDVQGSELEVLVGAGHLLDSIDAVQLEVNFEEFYEGQAQYDELFSFMHSRGFRRFFQLDDLISKRGKLLACDLVFFR
ncbi:MAG: FkbM family methyltransferase [Bacteroidetes bacterium]|nr:FkbM family methyltransferase [Bacteroidota bacterium]